jgi:NAD(P)-dependent dehydrogenase (short-subunit alcohol dehydrogenase family)
MSEVTIRRVTEEDFDNLAKLFREFNFKFNTEMASGQTIKLLEVVDEDKYVRESTRWILDDLVCLVAEREGARGRGLGHAQAGVDRDALADRGLAQPVEVVPHRLAEAGARVTVADVSGELPESTKKDLGELCDRVSFAQCDISREEQVKSMVGCAVTGMGAIDILVNNAGMAAVGRSEFLEEKVWRRSIDVMLTGTFFCSQAAGREMIKQKSGKIINIASINGITAFPEMAGYCSAKAGVMALTKVLASEWAKHNINVNAVAPGYVETELVNNLASSGKLNIDEIKRRTPGGRLASAEDVAETVVFLASDASKSINGQTIVIDNGWTAYGYLESWLKA